MIIASMKKRRGLWFICFSKYTSLITLLLLTSCSGHNKEIYDLAWSPCGRYFITASIDNTARVWSLSESKRGKKIRLE